MAERSTLKPALSSAVPALSPQGDQSGKPALPLSRPFTFVGSRNRAHLHLLSSTVSRNHACVIVTDAGVYLRDLASRTGVLVNGRRVKEVDLRDGDLLQIGSFKFKFTDPQGPNRFPVGAKAPVAMLEIGEMTLTPVEGRTVLIGRRPTCDIALPEASVSNTHAIIFEVNGQRFIRDLGSRTGTLVNGKPVHHQMLEFGDRVHVGEMDFRYVSAAGPREELDLDALPIEPPEEEHAPIGLHFDEPHPVQPELVDSHPVEAQSEPLAIGHDEEPAGVSSRHDLAPIPLDLEEPIPIEPAVAVEGHGAPEHSAVDHAAPEGAGGVDSILTAPADVLPATEDVGLDFLEEPADVARPADDAPPAAERPVAEAPVSLPPVAEELHSEPPATIAEEHEEHVAPDPTVEPSPEVDLLEPLTIEPVAELEPSTAPLEYEAVTEPETELPLEREPAVAETLEPVVEPEPTPVAVEPVVLAPVQETEEISPAPEPAIRVEEMDLSAVKFAADAEPVLEEVLPDLAAAAPVTPLLDLGVAAPVVAEAVAEVPDVPAPKAKKPRAPRKRKAKKGEPAGENSQAPLPEAETAAEPSSIEPVELAAEAAGGEAVNEAPLEAEPSVASPPVAPDTTLTAHVSDVAEVIEPTEPDPDSALDLGPSLSAPEADTIEPPAEVSLTDTAFGRAVSDLTTEESGPLVEAPAWNAAEPIASAEPPQPAHPIDLVAPHTMEPASPAAQSEFPPPPEAIHAAHEPVAFEAAPSAAEPDMIRFDAEHTLTGPADAGQEPELDLSFLNDEIGAEPLTGLDELNLEGPPGVAEAEVSIEPVADLPSSAPEVVSEISPAIAEVPPVVAEAAPVQTPPAAPSPAPAADPFFGMGRDMGTFIGGMPLPLPPAPAPAVVAPPVAPPVTVRPAAPPAPPVVEARPAAPRPQPHPPTPPAEEPLSFDEPPAGPSLADLLSEDEPLELFDGTADKLDAMPESLAPIDDVTAALQEDVLKSPPRAPAAPPPGARPAAKAPPAAEPPAARPRPVPPPPPRTAPLRSVTAVPPQTERPRGRNEVPRFTGDQPANRGKITAFQGLAMPPVREADVFSQTAFPPAGQEMFGALTEEVAPIPPFGGRPAGRAPQAPAEEPVEIPTAPAAAPRSGNDPAAATEKKTRDRRREAIPPNRQGSARPPQSAPPAPPAAKRKPWWKSVGFLLPVMFATMAVSVAGVYLLPRHGSVQGQLVIENLDRLDGASRKAALQSLRASLQNMHVRNVAMEQLKQAGIDPGFVADPAAFDEMARPENSQMADSKHAVLLTRPTDDPERDGRRMKAVLAAVYAENAASRDQSHAAVERQTELQSQIADLDRQHQSADLSVRKLSAEVRAFADEAAARDLLRDPAAASATLEQQGTALQSDWDKAAADLQQARADLKAAQAGVAAPSLDPQTDETSKDIRATLAALNDRLDAARLAQGGRTDEAERAFTDALARLDEQLSALSDASKDASLSAAVKNATQLSQELRRLHEQLLSRRDEDAVTLARLRKELDGRRAARLAVAVSGDQRISELTQEREAQARRYGTAADTGYTREAAGIKSKLDELDAKISARRAELAAGPGDDALESQLADTARKIGAEQARQEREIASKLDAMASALREPAVVSQPGVAEAVDASVAARAARDRYAAAMSAATAGPEGEVKKLQAAVAEQQAKLESRRRELADAAAAALAGPEQQQRRKTLLDAQARLDRAADDEARSAAAFSRNRKLLADVRELADARGTEAELSERLRHLREDARQQKAAAETAPVALPPDDRSVVVAAGGDPRLGYMAGAVLVVAGLFAGPLYLGMTGPGEEAPFAAPHVEAHETPESEDELRSYSDDHEPALI